MSQELEANARLLVSISAGSRYNPSPFFSNSHLKHRFRLTILSSEKSNFHYVFSLYQSFHYQYLLHLQTIKQTKEGYRTHTQQNGRIERGGL